VPALGAGVLARLEPKPGERILDLGRGDGTLTAQIAEHGATVVGVDSSAPMIAAACARGLDARAMDISALAFDDEFDAVFSNAVLHWVRDADAALAGVYRALRFGGRFVAEFGGHTNVAAITTALRAVLARHALDYEWPWYYPSPIEYRGKLEAHRFEVADVVLFPRPTPLPTGMDGWLRTFATPLFANVPPERKEQLIREVIDLLRPALCDEAGHWTADYVRLQVVAFKR
jgi:SAM-dependent methyltransferase